MARINYKSDFLLKVHFFDRAGKPAEVPGTLTVTLRTAGRRRFEAYRRGDLLTNMTLTPEDRGLANVACDGHGLYPGVLKAAVTAELPDRDYPDGYRRVTAEYTVGELVPEGEDSAGVLHLNVPLPTGEASAAACGCRIATEEEVDTAIEAALGEENPSVGLLT